MNRARALDRGPLCVVQPDDDAFEAVYAAHHDFAWRCLRALGVHPASVDDATQDVFVIVHRKLHRFDHKAPIKAWVFGIVRNVARRYRERAARPRPPLQVVDPPAPDEVTAWREAASVVERFLDELDDGQRAVFVLSQLEGMSVVEIAKTLRLKTNTAYSRLRLARQRFRRVVDREQAKRRRAHGRP